MDGVHGEGQQVRIAAGPARLTGELCIPQLARGAVLVAHESGGTRYSRRTRSIARVLQESGLATLTIDLLTPHEETVDGRTGQPRAAIPLLAERLLEATTWLAHASGTAHLPIGYLGVRTGAAAALLAAAAQPGAAGAVVSCMGRPDLARAALPRVRAPTLFIVGELDFSLIEVNEDAHALVQGPKRIAFIPGAMHLFEEPAALRVVGRLACDWFTRFLGSEPP